MAVTNWNVNAAYASAGFTAANFNSLATGSVVVASSAIANGTNLNLYADVSFSLVVGGTTLATSYLSLYILPINQDGSTYGDGTASGTTPPVSSYYVGSCGVKSGVASGSAVVGTFRGIVMPPRNFVFALVNNLGVALSSSAAASIEYSPFGESIA